MRANLLVVAERSRPARQRFDLGNYRQIHLGADLLQAFGWFEKPAAAAHRAIRAQALVGDDRGILQNSEVVSGMLYQTFHYSVASVVSAVIGLLSAIFFTRLLAPQEYGIYVVGLSTAGVVSAVLFTWVRVSALRFQSEGGSVDVRKTVLLAYLISVLASPLVFVVATLS